MATNSQFHEQFHSPSIHDPENRDPLRINKHLQLDFFSVIAEPDTSAYSFEAFHRASHHVYHYTKIFIYRFLTVLLALPLMLFWGLLFGVYTFLMIWLVVPSRRLMQTYVAEMGVQVQTVCDAIVAPLHRSMGQIFTSIRISVTKESVQVGKQIQI